jgi:hypothetical protein
MLGAAPPGRAELLFLARMDPPPIDRDEHPVLLACLARLALLARGRREKA